MPRREGGITSGVLGRWEEWQICNLRKKRRVKGKVNGVNVGNTKVRWYFDRKYLKVSSEWKEEDIYLCDLVLVWRVRECISISMSNHLSFLPFHKNFIPLFFSFYFLILKICSYTFFIRLILSLNLSRFSLCCCLFLIYNILVLIFM